MDVTAAADCRRVAEMPGNPFDGASGGPLARCLAIDMRELAQCQGGQIGAGPGPEILSRDVLAGDLVQIEVDLSRADSVALARIVQVLEELVPREVTTRFDNS